MRIVTSLCASSAAILLASSANAAYYLPGQISTPNWDPPNSPTMADMGGGIFEYSPSGLTPGNYYEFKILNVTDGSADWGDPGIPNSNSWLRAGAGGGATIRLNTNTLVDGNYPATNRISIIGGTAWTPQAVGDFMNEAGGAGDWNPDDSAFDMADMGGGLYQLTKTISTPGSYQYKNSYGSGWGFQLGADGLSINANTLPFTTTDPNQQVVFSANPGEGWVNVAVMPVPEPMSASLLAIGALALLRRRK